MGMAHGSVAAGECDCKAGDPILKNDRRMDNVTRNLARSMVILCMWASVLEVESS